MQLSAAILDLEEIFRNCDLVILFGVAYFEEEEDPNSNQFKRKIYQDLCGFSLFHSIIKSTNKMKWSKSSSIKKQAITNQR